MKINKRLLSFFLAVLMVVSTFGDSVYAITENAKANSTNKKTEIEGKVEGDKEVFTFDLSEFKSKESVAPMTAKAMPARAPRRAPAQWDTQVNIKTTGLNGKAFDWTALPNKEFKLIAKWETTDGQKHQKEIATITDTSDAKNFVNVGWPVDGTMKGNASVVTNYNGNIEVRVAITSGSATGGSGRLTFDITLTELAEPRVNVEYIDPYGRAITDPADLPSDADTMPKVTAEELSDVEIDLPKATGQINMRNSGDIDDDELNTAEAGLTYKVGGKVDSEKITIGGKEYIVDISQPSAKEIGTIKMVYQKDVIVPPADGDGNPVKPADGYVRLTFDANENKQDGIKGTHTAGDYAGKQKSYIDVKQGVQYDNANLQAAIKALSTTGTKEVNGETKTYAQDAENPWTPAVPNDTTAVVTATYNAQYKKSKAEQVQELGGLNPQTIKVWKDDRIDWEKGVAPKTTNTADAAVIQSLLDNAEVTDLSKRSSAAQGKFEGKLLVTFGDGSTLEVENQWLYVWEHIVTVDPNSTDPDAPQKEDLPRDKITVIFKAGEGIVNINTNGKTTYAKPNATLADTDFPADITYTDGYKNEVTWTPTDHKVDTKNRKYYDSKRQRFTFNASATKLAATQITEAGGLKGIDLAAWVGDTLDAKFWKDGVALADTVQDADGKLATLLAGATVTDKSNRDTDKKGTKPGKLIVTFADGSALEVDQKLFVYDKKDVVPTDPKQPTPKDAVVVTYQKGEGVTELTGTGKTLVKSGETLTNEDFPKATLEEGRKDLTWSGQTPGNPKDYTVTESNKVFTATAGKTVIPTNPDDPQTPQGYVLVTFE
ncbi:Rib/alpha-like domain-containing protein, partial [Peptoniphilus senegalensis]